MKNNRSPVFIRFSPPGTAYRRYLTPFLGLLMLSGCAATGRHQLPLQHDGRAGPPAQMKVTGTAQGNKKMNAIAAGAHRPQAEALSRCERELDALKLVNPEDYRRRVAVFSQLMTAASQYGSVRGEADANTTAAVDALYQYRVSRVCAGISWALLNALSERGEGHK